MGIFVKTIGPDEARNILKGNVSNRKIRTRVVQKYTNDMACGNWDMAALSVITIGVDGKLKDGQHRLLAVIKSGKKIPFIVNDQAAVEAHLFDVGAGRKLSDIATFNGEIMSNNDAAITRFVLLHVNGLPNPSYEVTMKYFNLHNDEIRTSASIALSGGRNPICRKAAVMVACYCAIRTNCDQVELERFFKITNGGFSENKNDYPAIVLRNYLISDKAKVNNDTQRIETLSITEQAIYDFVHGRSRKKKYIPSEKSSGAPYSGCVRLLDAKFMEENYKCKN